MSSLTASGRSLQSIYTNLNNAGAVGNKAFAQMYGQITKINAGTKQISSMSDKIMNTLGNTVR
jgi:hypothetical protein